MYPENQTQENSVPPSAESTDKLPKITVATVTWNAGKLITRTIESVERQTYANVEHLIVDGNSHDDTLEHVHHYQERNSRAAVRHEIVCISEPDEGLYDAMNKAIDMATGRYILFLNAGDTFHADNILELIAEAIKNHPHSLLWCMATRILLTKTDSLCVDVVLLLPNILLGAHLKTEC